MPPALPGETLHQNALLHRKEPAASPTILFLPEDVVEKELQAPESLQCPGPVPDPGHLPSLYEDQLPRRSLISAFKCAPDKKMVAAARRKMSSVLF